MSVRGPNNVGRAVLLARPSRFPRAQNPVSLPFQTPATQAKPAASRVSQSLKFTILNPYHGLAGYNKVT